MAKYKYKGDQIIRATIAGKYLMLEPGAEFEIEKTNSYIDSLKQKGIVVEVKEKTPPPKQ